MPRCEGIPPDGRCPRNVNNRSVKLSQGDLRLCPSCDAFRFPTNQPHEKTASTTPAQRKASVTTSRKQATSTKVKSMPNMKNMVLNADCNVGNPTTTNATTNAIVDNCAVCNEPADECSVKCVICDCLVHGMCSGVSDDIVEKLLEIISTTLYGCA